MFPGTMFSPNNDIILRLALETLFESPAVEKSFSCTLRSLQWNSTYSV